MATQASKPSAAFSPTASWGRKSRRSPAIESSIHPYSAREYFQKCWWASMRMAPRRLHRRYRSRARRARRIARFHERHRFDRVFDRRHEGAILAGDKPLQVRHRTFEGFGEPRPSKKQRMPLAVQRDLHLVGWSGRIIQIHSQRQDCCALRPFDLQHRGPMRAFVLVRVVKGEGTADAITVIEHDRTACITKFVEGRMSDRPA